MMPDLLDTLTDKGGVAPSAALMERLGQILDDDNEHTGPDWADFDWTDEVTVVGEQRPIAVYRNPSQGIVIRERGDDSPNDDQFLVLRDAVAVQALIERLAAEIGSRA
jgi:hypothetical protein